MPPGAMVLSFDFELAWGTRSSSQRAENGHDFAGHQAVIERLLEILVRHEISATWATVGHLMLSPEETRGGRFAIDVPPPRYDWFQGAWYDGIPGPNEAGAEAFYAPQSVRTIIDCPVSQELASHSFTHILFDERACPAETARGELQMCRQVAQRWGQTLRSLVFPRNRVGHLPVLAELGYRCYRGANSEWYWFGHSEAIYARRWLRLPVWVLRLIDERLCFTPPLPPVKRRADLWEIPHSMFFAGLSGVSQWVTPEQRVRRATRGLDRAAHEGRVFSLWTHPHNFLPTPERLLPAFDAICAHAAKLREAGQLEILTMGEMAAQLDAGRNRHWTELSQ